MSLKKKLVIFAAVVVLIAGAFTVRALTMKPIMEIDACRLSFGEGDNLALGYAVSFDNVGRNDIRMLVWTEPQSAYEYGTHDYEFYGSELEKLSGRYYEIFYYPHASAARLNENIYVRAYTEVRGKAYYSEVSKYSVLQYIYNKLGLTGTAATSDTLKSRLREMIRDIPAHTRIKLEGGVLVSDNCTTGLYLPGEELAVRAPETDARGKAFSHWEDSSGTRVSDTAEWTLTVGEMHEIYTAVYLS